MNNQDPKRQIEIRSLNHADFSEIAQFQELDDDEAAQIYGGGLGLDDQICPVDRISCFIDGGGCPIDSIGICGLLTQCGNNTGPCSSLSNCGTNGGCPSNAGGCPSLQTCTRNSE
jgi:hypothetical protein